MRAWHAGWRSRLGREIGEIGIGGRERLIRLRRYRSRPDRRHSVRASAGKSFTLAFWLYCKALI
jgi:hypothetical protein